MRGESRKEVERKKIKRECTREGKWKEQGRMKKASP